ncbi:MAG: SEC-C metal-binding domain-containing protein [Candidatus Paceibacterota bacterium]
MTPVPTNVSAIRKDKNDQIFRTELGKFKALSRKVKEVHLNGQPILIGTVSIEKNEILSQFLKAEGIPHQVLNAKNHEHEGEIIAQAGRKGAVTIATNMAGRGVDIKLGGNPNSPELYAEVKNAGGLFVLGTERHEARRIDNQLRGRSGRQGDPGETQFFVSLEDTLMRVFASDTLKSMMVRLKVPEDEAIEHKFISKALEAAQEKIEGFNFDSRKQVLEFDDIINHQRTAIYGRRRKLLLGSLDEVEKDLFEITGGEKKEVGSRKQEERAMNEAGNDADSVGTFGGREGDREGAAAPAGDDGDPHRAASLPASNIRDIIQKKYSEFGRESFLKAVRIILLQTIDMYWVEHLEVMDYTRSSVNLRAYGQRDPLVEYKKEGLRLFKEMQAIMTAQVVKILPHVVPVGGMEKEALLRSDKNRSFEGQEGSKEKGENAGLSKAGINADLKEVHENAQIIGGGDGSSNAPVTKKEPEIGRNDLCPCGSGKKYKKCHGK